MTNEREGEKERWIERDMIEEEKRRERRKTRRKGKERWGKENESGQIEDRE